MPPRRIEQSRPHGEHEAGTGDKVANQFARRDPHTTDAPKIKKQQRLNRDQTGDETRQTAIGESGGESLQRELPVSNRCGGDDAARSGAGAAQATLANPSRWARSLKNTRRWAIGLRRTSFLCM